MAASQGVKTYDPRKVTLTFAGSEISGYADGTFIEIEAIGDGVTSKCGADGEVSRAMSADTRKTITVTLAGTSSSNDVLSNIYNRDQLSGDGIGSLIVKDLSGTTYITAPQAWIVKSATKGFSVEGEDVEWTIETGQVTENTIGGNN